MSSTEASPSILALSTEDFSSHFSSYAHSTYSVDEEIENYLKELKKQKSKENEAVAENRKNKFLKINQKRKLSIFHLDGLSCKQFNYKIVKFSFKPSTIFKKLYPKIKFYISFHWYPRYKQWFLKREPMPGTGILFYKGFINYEIDDDTLPKAVKVVYKGLLRWSKEYENFRIHRFKLFRQGHLEYFELDSEDEFLLPKEVCQYVRNKRRTVWRRMIPPINRGERYSELETTSVSTEHDSAVQTNESFSE